MRAKLTPRFVLDAPAPSAGKIFYWDETLSGFGLVVTAAGHKSWAVQYRYRGRSVRKVFKAALTAKGAGLTLDKARIEARKIIGDVARGLDPVGDRRRQEKEAKKREAIDANTLRAVAERFFTDASDTGGAKLRTIGQRIAMFKRDIFPTLGDRPISGLTRREIRDLIEAIERNSGGRSSHQAHGYLKALLNWYATKDDDFCSPIVKGMSSFKPSKHVRSRVLSDEEIRAIWKGTEPRGDRDDSYGALVRFVLLTATRRNEAAQIKWSELEGDDWIIPARRYKTGIIHLVPLSAAARAILTNLPKFKGCAYVFTSTGHRHINNFSHDQKNLKLKTGTSDWTLHDLRRSARTLMSRAGANVDHAERALGHVMGSIRGTYDHHEYRNERLKVFEALAAQIDLIVNPLVDNVVPIRLAAS
jgi:integrase